jgi:Family of unknown function (DUF5908)
MPIEIKELTIKVNVNQEQGNKNASAGSGTVGKENEDKESLMKEAAEQVLRILENKKER